MLESGLVLDRYTVEGLIGSGGMADVYRVRHNDLGSLHALKVLKARADHVAQRLKQEGRVQASLRHPNIVAVTDLLEVDGAPGLVMEYVDGPSLDDLLKDELSDAAREAIALGVLAGVNEAHRQGLVHRDLKPANVLILWTPEGPVPKIADFGLVKSLAVDEGATRVTKTGYAMGTPQFMAPEQIRDAKNVDERADLFSLGALLYELVCGTPAFPGEDMLEVFNNIVQGRFIVPIDVKPELPPRVDRAIRAALIADREHRVSDCQTLIRLWTGDLADFQVPPARGGRRGASLDTAETYDPGAYAPNPTLLQTTGDVEPPSRPVALWAGLAVAGLALVGGAGWWFAAGGVSEPLDASVEVVGQPAEPVEVQPVAEPVAPDEGALDGSEPAAPEPHPSGDGAAAVTPRTPVAQDPAPATSAPPGDEVLAPEPEAAQMATLRVEGDADEVWFVGPAGRVEPGSLPPGRYEIYAVFSGGEPMTTGTVTLAEGETRTLRCSSGFTICK